MTNTAPIRITQTGVEVDHRLVGSLRSEFAETGCAIFPGFLTPQVLEPLMRNLETARFEERHELTPAGACFGTTLKIPFSEPVMSSFLFILNRSPLFDVVREITSSEVLGNFIARIHRTTPDRERHIDWHDDVYKYRAVGLDINLSRQAFQGGEFLIRDSSRHVRREIGGEWVAGDAFLFQVSQGWQHRLAPVSFGERTVGVGWFRTRPARASNMVAQLGAGVSSLMATAPEIQRYE